MRPKNSEALHMPVHDIRAYSISESERETHSTSKETAQHVHRHSRA